MTPEAKKRRNLQEAEDRQAQEDNVCSGECAVGSLGIGQVGGALTSDSCWQKVTQNQGLKVRLVAGNSL